MSAWRLINCPRCGGHCVIEAWGGGPADCGECGGGGFFYITSSGRLADYPGGPFRGMWSHEAWERAQPITVAS